MATYSFETITAAQALAFTASDTLNVNGGTASASTVIYNAGGDIALTLGAVTVDFSAAFAAASQAGHVTFADGSVLYVGDGASNTKDFGVFNPLSGAIFGGGGNDTFHASAGNFLIQGNAGNDTLFAGSEGNNTIYGGQGDDDISIAVGPNGSGVNFVQGNKGDDAIVGGAGPDTLLGGQGDDTISGDGGIDFINGNLGNDSLIGRGQLFGEDGADTIANDTSGPAIISGGPGPDRLFSAILNGTIGGPTTIDGDDGNDTIIVRGPAHDEVHGDVGNDTITDSSAGEDILDGGANPDNISTDAGAFHATSLGGDGDDTLSGAGGHCTMSGGAGDDMIHFQGGALVAFGGDGADTFILETTASRAGDAPSDQDFIQDWSHDDHIHNANQNVALMTYSEGTAHDTIAAEDLYRNAPANAVVAVQVGTAVMVFMQSATPDPLGHSIQAIILSGRTLADIDASNFI